MLSVLIVKLLCLALLSVSFLHAVTAQADIAIIVHLSNDNRLSLTKIRKIFLAKTKAFPDGSPVKAIQTNEDDIRHQFNRHVFKRSDSAINSYWARMLFSSKAKPPAILGDAARVKSAIAANPHGIAYIDAADVDETVKVAMIVETSR